jgi:hypothetical protein
MKDFYDLRSVLDMSAFPWSEIPVGIAKSNKKASIFYGHTSNTGGLTPEQNTWYASITNGTALNGLDILLTSATTWADAWYKLGHRDHWTETVNIQYFPALQNWICNSNIFEETGRQIIFIQLQHSSTPRHVDQDINLAPVEYRKNQEFIWITSETNGKKLFVNNIQVPNVVWFNSYQEHYTLPDNGLRWSLRIDGKFTKEFKEKVTQL